MLNAHAIENDIYVINRWGAPVQRYSSSRDSFVTLTLDAGLFVMQDHQTGETHQIDRDSTSVERLTSHWTGFLNTHQADR
jgi:hypothetical protein